MKVYITEVLELIDTRTGGDSAPDIMGIDGNIAFEDGVAIMDMETFRWWHEVLADLDDAYFHLEAYLDTVDDPDKARLYILYNAAYADIEDQADAIFEGIAHHRRKDGTI